MRSFQFCSNFKICGNAILPKDRFIPSQNTQRTPREHKEVQGLRENNPQKVAIKKIIGEVPQVEKQQPIRATHINLSTP